MNAVSDLIMPVPVTTLLEHGPLALLIYTEGTITYANRAAHDLLGYELGTSPVGCSLLDIVHPDSQAALAKLLEDGADRVGEVARQEVELRRRDGLLGTVEITCARVPGTTPPCYQVALVDVTDRRRNEQRLQANSVSLRAILDNAPLGIWMLRHDGRLGFVNKAFCAAVGIDEPRFLAAADYASLYDEETAANCKRSDAEALSADGAHLSHERLYLCDGEMHDLEITKARFADADGNVGLVGISADVTEKRVAEEKLRLLAGVFAHAREGILITDLRGVIVDVNPSMVAITGFPREQLIGQTTRLFKSGRQDEAFYQGIWRAINANGEWQGEIWNRCADGSVIPQLMSITRLSASGSGPDHYVAIYTDISEIKAQQERLRYLAYYDALTGLPNRALFTDRLAVAMANASRSGANLAVCCLDLDGFKPINDRHGHQLGDQVLIQIGHRLVHAVRAGDTVARLGGDEFMLLLAGLDDASERALALDRILRQLSESIDIEGQVVRVSGSIGVTMFPADDADSDTLIRHADQAMYVAKQAGGNRHHLFDISFDKDAVLRRETGARLMSGLAQGELSLYYQPIVDMRTGRVWGMEALARWQHPQRGLLSPAAFLPMIEGSEAEVGFGKWVMRTALAQLREWTALGLELVVSVNISPHHLAHPGFVDWVREMLGETPNICPGTLKIEVLETAALNDLDAVSRTITRCRNLGIGVSLDDFGTGYSSLTYLRRLPADTLKIDQTFVRDMLDNSDDFAIVEGVIGLGLAFRRHVVAEGVESEDHGAMLLRLGCDLAQGYGIAQPMTAAGVPEWIRTWQMPQKWASAVGVPYAPSDLDLLMAEIDHRQWMKRLREALAASSWVTSSAPEMDPEHCRLGHWLQGIGRERHGRQRQFQDLVAAHRRLHECGDALLAASRPGLSRGTPARPITTLTEVEKLHDFVLQAIRALLLCQSVPPSPRAPDRAPEPRGSGARRLKAASKDGV